MRAVIDSMRPLIPLLRWFFGLFFDRSYMTGPLYEGSFAGYRRYLTALWQQKVLGFNRAAPWPVSPTVTISRYDKLHIAPGDIGNLSSPGCYFQNFSANIYIGTGTYIAPNVGLITANHSRRSLAEHDVGQDVRIGDECWIGMNAVILPGVTLGPRTVVGAGSVVTKSFPLGDVTLVGAPARPIPQQ